MTPPRAKEPAADEGQSGDEPVRAALAALPADQRRTVVAAYYGRQSVRQIAADQGVSEATVASIMHVALARLRVTLRER
ncbi:RNA polymerase sigma factor [Nocardia mexicana]|uniref:RNA polymerase sigma factor (Sigma-70 family) n=1 Tax=Nocardia mexicana TaxID=279262 RepID=A0A370GE01_9NOCA|nr:sigma factor-like helix-turn-helix DNA-binding protein [Nocardia mexicana]RDI42028.1 RNA polymerase sigma factor (sigma-70 family) [Nocardia mexicana]